MHSIKTNGGLTRGRGVFEVLWTLNLNYTSSVHCAMMELTSMVVNTYNQLVDITEPRQKQDSTGYDNFKMQLKEINPFEFIDANLHSLSSGLVPLAEKYQVNCDDAEQLGAKIHQQLQETSLANANIKQQIVLIHWLLCLTLSKLMTNKFSQIAMFFSLILLLLLNVKMMSRNTLRLRC